MSKQLSPFAALTGAEKQIRWLEYQSIRLPYVPTAVDDGPSCVQAASSQKQREPKPEITTQPCTCEEAPPAEPRRPIPPPEIPRRLPYSDFQRSHHSQYDAVIARMKQAEMQARGFTSSMSK